MSVSMEQRGPVPSEQQQQQQQRPRSHSRFSFKSDKSGGPSHSHSQSPSSQQHRRTTSGEQKDHLHAATKADPNAAMNESQPIAAALEKPTLQSLRSVQHTDLHGNPIVEPDLSNPTRSRWERPLDTIRSFEAAIDSEYRRRSHAVRGGGDAGTDMMSNYGSRRSSYYGGGYDQNRFSQVSGYYGSRQSARDSYIDPGHGMGGPVGGPPRTRNNRMQSDPGWNRYSTGNGVYPNHGYQQSRDTVNTNGSNGSHSDPYTDPSSENSSVERATPVTRPDLGEQYGFQGFGGGPILEEYPLSPGQNQGYLTQQPNGANGYGGPPPVPAKAMPPPRNQPIKLSQSNGAPSTNGDGRHNVLQRQNTDKRRSWFKRRFSKE